MKRHCFCYFFKAKPVKLDLGVLFGASGKNASEIFSAQKEIVKSMLDTLQITPNTTLLGAVTYGRDATVSIRFGSVDNTRDTKNAIDAIQTPGDGTNLNNAMEVARDKLFSPVYGSRSGTPKTLLVFVNKRPSDFPLDLAKVTKTFKDAQIKIVVVGMGDEVDESQLKNIADKEYLPKSISDSQKLRIPLVKAVLPGM